jgi:hypothetical protein
MASYPMKLADAYMRYGDHRQPLRSPRDVAANHDAGSSRKKEAIWQSIRFSALPRHPSRAACEAGFEIRVPPWPARHDASQTQRNIVLSRAQLSVELLPGRLQLLGWWGQRVLRSLAWTAEPAAVHFRFRATW